MYDAEWDATALTLHYMNYAHTYTSPKYPEKYAVKTILL